MYTPLLNKPPPSTITSPRVPAFIYARAIDNPCSICLGVSILRHKWSETLATQAKSERLPFCCVGFIGNIPLLKIFKKLFSTFIGSIYFSISISFFLLVCFLFWSSFIIKFLNYFVKYCFVFQKSHLL